MRRYSKSLISLILVSSVATSVLVVGDAEARRNSRQQLPSVEINLEVLNSLRYAATQESYVSVPAHNASALPPRVSERPLMQPPAGAGGPVAQIAREIPARTTYPIAGNGARSQVIAQPLKGRNVQVGATSSGRPIERRVARSSEVIMQPLPGKQGGAVARKRYPIAGNVPEEIIMQPMPVTPETMEMAGDEALPTVVPEVAVEGGGVAAIAADMTGQTATGAAVVVAEESSGGFFDSVLDLFGGDESEGEVKTPALKTPPRSASIEPLPVEVLTDDSVVSETPVASEAASDESGGFFSDIQEIVGGSESQALPEKAIPVEPVIKRVTPPELRADAPKAPRGSDIPSPIVQQRYDEVVETVEPEVATENVPPVVDPATAPAQPLESLSQIMPDEPKVIERQVIAQPIVRAPKDPVRLEEPAAQELPVPGGFAIAEKLESSETPKTAVKKPIEAAKNKAEQVRSPIYAPPPAVEKLPEVEPAAEMASESKAEEFPALSSLASEVEKLPEVSTGTSQSAAEWLAQESQPAVAEQKSAMPFPELEGAEEPAIEQPVMQPLPEPVKTPEVAVVTEEKPVMPAVTEPVLQPLPPEPMVESMPEVAPTLSQEAIPELEALPEPSFNSADFSDAESSLLSNAKEAGKKVEMAVDENALSPMEQALEEIEPLKEPEIPEVPEVVEAAAMPEPVAVPEPVIMPEPVVESKVVDVPAPVSTPTPTPVQKVEEEGMFSGIAKSFKGMLEDEPSSEVVAQAPAPVPAPVAEEVKPEIQETAKNVMPPELPAAQEEEKSALPSMQLLDEEEVESRFIMDEGDLPELSSVKEPVIEAPVTQPQPTPEVIAQPVVAPAPVPESFEVASLPPEPEIKKAPKPATSTSGVATLMVSYGADDTDIPDDKKSALKAIADQAQAGEKRIIISSYASGEEGESKAANMVSLSRGLSLRAFFIDSGVPMDRIIVQAKGMENPGGAKDRADIMLD